VGEGGSRKIKLDLSFLYGWVQSVQRMRPRKFLFLMLPVFFLFAGGLADPFWGFLVLLVYAVGVAGLLMVVGSLQRKNRLEAWTWLLGGWALVGICFGWMLMLMRLVHWI
jgi:multisubunit Na+/H+ antiporter MnhB subunit